MGSKIVINSKTELRCSGNGGWGRSDTASSSGTLLKTVLKTLDSFLFQTVEDLCTRGDKSTGCLDKLAWDFLEVDNFAVRSHASTSGIVCVKITFVYPWVVVGSEASWGYLTGLLARVQVLEFSEHLGSSGDIESFVGGNSLNFLCFLLSDDDWNVDFLLVTIASMSSMPIAKGFLYFAIRFLTV